MIKATVIGLSACLTLIKPRRGAVDGSPRCCSASATVRPARAPSPTSPRTTRPVPRRRHHLPRTRLTAALPVHDPRRLDRGAVIDPNHT